MALSHRVATHPERGRGKIALVLAGGAARGAYEVGVLDYIVNDVGRALGRQVPIDILCGTSVGAINACALAAHIDDPQLAMQRLVDQWTSLRIGHVVRVDTSEVFAAVRGIFGTRPPTDGGILDPAGLQRIVSTAIPFDRIGEHIASGKLDALTVSTTHVATGQTIVFVQTRGELPYWGKHETVQPRPAVITASHALASAAIPFVFPPVAIDDELHCDGGLRQNVPLSPARRLGADGLIVVSPRYMGHLEQGEVIDGAAQEEPAHPGDALFLLGKMLNALMLDRIDTDIDRLTRTTAMLEAGTRIYGPDFVEKLNREMGRSGVRAARPIQAVLVRVSQDISKLASEFVSAPAFLSRASGVVRRLMRRMAAGGGRRGSDLLSYLLFDGEFARQLIEIGRQDARLRHEELCAFFDKLHPAARVAS